MTITIPEWVLWLPLWYVGVGLVLTLPLLAWSNSRIHNSGWSWHHGWTRPQAWAVSAVVWPWLIWDLWMTPRRNKKVMDNYRKARDTWND